MFESHKFSNDKRLEEFLTEHALRPLKEPELYDDVYILKPKKILIYTKFEPRLIEHIKTCYPELKTLEVYSNQQEIKDGIYVCFSNPMQIMKSYILKQFDKSFYYQPFNNEDRVYIFEQIYNNFNNLCEKKKFSHKSQLNKEDFEYLASKSDGATFEEILSYCRKTFESVLKDTDITREVIEEHMDIVYGISQ